MIKTKKRLALILALVLLTFITIIAVSCAPSQTAPSSSNTSGSAETTVAENHDEAYVSDEECMSCHGQSYEAVAKLTNKLGDWNPHDSIHGGYNACNNCHLANKELSYNYCEQCHVYSPEDEAIFLS